MHGEIKLNKAFFTKVFIRLTSIKTKIQLVYMTESPVYLERETHSSEISKQQKLLF